MDIIGVKLLCDLYSYLIRSVLLIIMGNFGSQPETQEPENAQQLSQHYQKLLEDENLMERITRFRWKLERPSSLGIEFEILRENQEILIELRNHPQIEGSTINWILDLIAENPLDSRISHDLTEKMIQDIFSCQELIYRKMLLSGCEEQLLILLPQLTNQLQTIRSHLQENVRNLSANRLDLMRQIEQKHQEVEMKLRNKLGRFKLEQDLDRKERILRSIGKLFNSLRDLGDQIRNVIAVDTQAIILNETIEMQFSTQLPTFGTVLGYHAHRYLKWLEPVFDLFMYLSVVHLIARSYRGNRLKALLRKDLREIDQSKWDLGNVLKIVDDARSWLVIYCRPEDR